jgi:cyclopropane-fatty-acyl-phospholipid synthase
MDWLIRQVFRRIVTRGDLSIISPAGTRLRFGDGTGEPVVVRLADNRAVLALIGDPDMRLGELFMDGRFVVETGTVLDFLVLCLREAQNGSHSAVARFLDKTRELLWSWRLPNWATRSRRNVAHHYDLDGRLYALFLDDDRQYSCAYFADATQSLEEAQRDKKRHIIRKLRLRPGDSVLDIGCGWGGLAHSVAEAGAGSVVGVTLSEEQLAYARARPVKGPVAPRFDLIDYRAVTGRFDRIVSVGMFEHVGRASFETFFRTADRLMADDGVMLMHTIGCAAGTGFTTPWVDKYIFPGGYIPALSEITLAVERAGLMVSDVEVLHTHYAWTLAEWRRRFLARRDEALALYDERFCRMWEFYLSSAEAAFLCEDLVIFQVQIVKRPQTAPMRRDYLYPPIPATPAPEPTP